MSMGSGGIFGDPERLRRYGIDNGINLPPSPMRRPGGLFGGSPSTPPMPQLDMETQGAIDQYATMPMQPKPQGKPNWLGVLADALAGAAGREPMYLNSVLAQRKEEQAAQQAAANREADWNMFTRKFDYEQRNKPANPYRWEANDGSLMEVGPDGQPKVVYKDPTAKINWVRADNGDGTFTMVPVGPQGAMSGNTPPPAKPVGRLTPIGGPQASPAGGFR